VKARARDGGRRFAQVGLMKAVNAVDFIYRKRKPLSVPVGDEQAVKNGAQPFGRRADFQAEQSGEGRAEEEFAADVDEAEDDAQPPMRQAVQDAAFGDFLKCGGREREPFRAQPEKHDGSFGGRGQSFLRRVMLGPSMAIFRAEWPVQETGGGGGKDGTIVTMNMTLQFATGLVAVDADLIPAINDFVPLLVVAGHGEVHQHRRGGAGVRDTWSI